MAVDNIATLGIKVDPRKAIYGSKKAKRAIKGIGNTAKRVKDQIFSLNGALGVLGAGVVLRSALKYTSTVENLGVRLKFLTGSTEDASKAFKTMLGFAKQAPFTLQEIQNASPSLLTVADNVDELNQLLEITGDIATVSGLSFEIVGQQLQRSFSGGIAAADLFRDSGVKAMLGFQTGVSYTAEQTKNTIVDMWKKGQISMVGATKELAKTFTGQVSMMSDAWDALTLAFMKEGIFDETKSSVQELTEWLKSPETIQGAKDLGNSVTKIALSIKGAILDFNALPSYIKEVGLVFAVFGGLKGKVALAFIITQAETLKALLQSLGLMDYSAEHIHTALQKVEQQIDSIKKAIPETSWLSLLQKGLFGGLIPGTEMLEEYEDARDELLEMWEELPILERDAYLLGISKVGNSKQQFLMQDYVKSYKDANVELSSVSPPKFNANLPKFNRGIVIEHNKSYKDLNTTLTDTAVAYELIGKHMEKNTAIFDDTAEQLEKARLAEIVESMADSMETSITDAIMNIGQGVTSLKDMFKDLARIILKQFVQISVAKPAADWLAGAAGSLFSADGGGYTGAGTRTGGIDNKGGFPAILHPNETVIDHTKGGNAGTNNVNVSFNITANDTNGFDELLESRRGMIVNLINGAMNDRGTLGVV